MIPNEIGFILLGYIFILSFCAFLISKSKWWNKYYWFNIKTRCPRCHTKLIPRGYEDEWGGQAYKCMKCGFGDE